MKSILIFSITLVILGPGVSHAYIDPNTGGYVFQILFPVISAIAAAFLFFKNRMVMLIKKISSLFNKNS